MVKEYHTVASEEAMGSLSPERQARIKARGAELIAEEVALRDLRRTKYVTQEQVAERLGGRQA
jgi:hypothetical protein